MLVQPGQPLEGRLDILGRNVADLLRAQHAHKPPADKA
jgi:hypothetical protein